jgi:RNA polymerase sigma-70 factor (ECF subfamily)
MTESGTVSEDNTLILMALAGQAECYSVLMARHTMAVQTCIKSIVGNISDVDDIVQDTFMKAWSHLSSFRFESSFRTWITRVAMNEALSLYRRQKSRPICVAVENLEIFSSIGDSPEQILARSEKRLRVRTAVERLPRKYRDILVLCDLDDLGTQETARRLKSSIPLVKTRLFRARHMLSRALQKAAA